MITQYLGNDTYIISLTSGKEVELTDTDINEIVNNNVTTRTKIQDMENSIIKYRMLYSDTNDMLKESKDNIRFVFKVLNDNTYSNDDKINILLEQLKIVNRCINSLYL